MNIMHLRLSSKNLHTCIRIEEPFEAHRVNLPSPGLCDISVPATEVERPPTVV